MLSLSVGYMKSCIRFKLTLLIFTHCPCSLVVVAVVVVEAVVVVLVVVMLAIGIFQFLEAMEFAFSTVQVVLQCVL